jgi:hypothetical protein
MSLIDILGLVGVAAIICAYFLIQSEKLSATQPIYSILNLVGASLILFSLFFEWNLSAVIIEVFWIIISVYGLKRGFQSRKKNNEVMP